MSNLQRWQQVWAVCAVVLLVVVVSAASENAPNRETMMKHWASELRWSVERSDLFRSRRDDIAQARYEATHPEEKGSYGGMSPEQVILELHARHRLILGSLAVQELDAIARRRGYSSFDAMTTTTQTVAVDPEMTASVASTLTNVDARYLEEARTLRSRRLNAIGMPLLLAWALPMGLWYGLGSTVSQWRPFLRANRTVIAGIMFVVGAGVLVVGIMDSDSFSGGVGAMVLVGGFLTWKGLPQR